MVPSSVNVASLTYPSTLRILIHCARRALLNPRTGPETRCDTVQNGQTNRVPCAFGIVSTITAQPARHNRYCTCGAGVSFEAFTATFAAGFAARFTARRGAAFLARRVAGRPARLVDLRDVRVAAIGFAPKLQLAVTSVLRTLYLLRRSTITRSLGRFLRVFAPSVGKPHGVCGWFPFTRPSPPPCGWSTGFMATPRLVGRRPCQRVRPALP